MTKTTDIKSDTDWNMPSTSAVTEYQHDLVLMEVGDMENRKRTATSTTDNDPPCKYIKSGEEQTKKYRVRYQATEPRVDHKLSPKSNAQRQREFKARQKQKKERLRIKLIS